MSKVVWPLDGAYGKNFRTTSGFGWRTHPIQKTRKHHNGEDLIGQKYVKAMAAGTVLSARASKSKKANGEPGGFGYFVSIRHKIDGVYYTSLYAHLAKGSMQVKEGQKVEAGQILGVMGTTGASTGVHLHWEIWKGKTHGWSSNGTGFADPIAFVQAFGAKESVASSISKPSIDSEAVAKIKVPTSKPEYKEALSVGDRGEEVAYLQSQLGVETVGIFGPKTKAAVIKFQRKFPGIVADGVVGPITWAKIPGKTPTKAAPAKAVKPVKVTKPAAPVKQKTHTVVRGDTLGRIASRNKTTVAALATLNGIKNVNAINVGQVIKLP